MKNLINFNRINLFIMFLMSGLATIIVKAQEKKPDLKVDVDINKGAEAVTSNSSTMMSNPLMWVIGGLVLLVLVAIIARSGSSKNA